MAEDTRKLFDLDLDSTPDLTWRIAIGILGSLSRNMTLQQLSDLITQNLDVYDTQQIDDFFENYLSKTNLAPYTPTLDYHPATLKTVKDNSNASYIAITSTGNVSDFVGNVAQSDNVVHFTGEFEDANLQDGDTIFTLPTEITPPDVDIYFTCNRATDGGIVRAKINAGTRVAYVQNQEVGTGVAMSFNAMYLTSN